MLDHDDDAPHTTRIVRDWLLVAVVCALAFLILYRLYCLHSHPLIPVSRVAATAKSGDLLLYASDSNPPGVPAACRKMLLGSEWSHVGILYIDPRTSQAYVWESGQGDHNKLTDVLTGTRGKAGPMLTPFEANVRTYHGHIVLGRLDPPLESLVGGADEVDRRFQEIFRNCAPLTFNQNLYSLGATAVLSQWLPIKIPHSFWHDLRARFAKPSAVHCCELAAYTYTMFGLWDHTDNKPRRPPWTFAPPDYAESDNLGKVRLRDLCEIQVK